MKYVFAIFVIFCKLSLAEEVNPDVLMLCEQIQAIGGNRWDLSVENGDIIVFNSKKEVLGTAHGYNYRPGEGHHRLRFRFRIVEAVSADHVTELRQHLVALKQQAKPFETGFGPSRMQSGYAPTTREQWALVFRIRRLENRIEDIPEHRYKSVYLSEEYNMDFFVANKGDKDAVQCMKDVKEMLGLLTTLP